MGMGVGVEGHTRVDKALHTCTPWCAYAAMSGSSITGESSIPLCFIPSPPPHVHPPPRDDGSPPPREEPSPSDGSPPGGVDRTPLPTSQF